MNIRNPIKIAAVLVSVSIFLLYAEQKSHKNDNARALKIPAKTTCVEHTENATCNHTDTLNCEHLTIKNNVSTETKATENSKKQILFFMNPNGQPCQMQLSIIEKMKLKLENVAAITFIKTTESKDQQLFQKYGIRGLPSLIIVDSSGKEIHRFTPGIQEEKTILTVLAQK